MIIPNADILSLTQGEGQGYAQKFAPSSWDPVRFMENLNAANRTRSMQKMQREIENRKEAADYRKRLLTMPDDVTQFSRAAIESHINKGVDEIVNYEKETGKRLAGTPEGEKLMAQFQNTTQALASEGKMINDTVKSYVTAAKEGKISAKELDNWYKGFEQIYKTGSEDELLAAAEYVRTNTPFKPKFDSKEFFATVLKDPAVREEFIAGKPGFTETLTGYGLLGEEGKEMLRDKIRGVLFTYEQDNPEGTQIFYNKGVEEGLYRDYEGFVDYLADEALKMGETKRTVEGRAPSTKKGGGLTIGSYQVPKKITPAAKSTFGKTGEATEVSVKRDGKDLAPMEVLDRDGKLVYFKPSVYYKVPDSGIGVRSGLSPNKWAVKGQVFGRTGEEKIKAGETEEEALQRLRGQYGNNAEVIPSGNGSTFTIYKPLKEDVIDYETNDIRFQTAADGFDLIEYVNEWNKTNAGKSKEKSNTQVNLPQDIDPN